MTERMRERTLDRMHRMHRIGLSQFLPGILFILFILSGTSR